MTIPGMFVRRSRQMIIRSISRFAPSQWNGSQAVLVVAPHPDDEVFGAGGLIAMKRAAGVRVYVVLMTGGEASHANCCGVPAEEVATNRRRLAAAAGRALGLDESALHWLGLKDGSVPGPGQGGFDEAVGRLAGLLVRLSPEEVYCPHPSDVWRDHVAACEIARAAVARAAWGGKLFYYLVWAWHNLPLCGILELGWRSAVRLDIRGVFAQKRRAMEAYLGEVAPGCGKPGRRNTARPRLN